MLAILLARVGGGADCSAPARVTGRVQCIPLACGPVVEQPVRWAWAQPGGSAIVSGRSRVAAGGITCVSQVAGNIRARFGCRASACFQRRLRWGGQAVHRSLQWCGGRMRWRR